MKNKYEIIYDELVKTNDAKEYFKYVENELSKIKITGNGTCKSKTYLEITFDNKTQRVYENDVNIKYNTDDIQREAAFIGERNLISNIRIENLSFEVILFGLYMDGVWMRPFSEFLINHVENKFSTLKKKVEITLEKEILLK
ncbi:MAG TPA: hypothetical protein ENI76_07830 [Ignavibacteria bacterium]|nr:hypothetical protein [Ignavibacteria bacterium]